MEALFFFGGIVIVVAAFFTGKLVQKQADKPVQIPEQMEHDMNTHPHHVHAHDLPKK